MCGPVRKAWQKGWTIALGMVKQDEFLANGTMDGVQDKKQWDGLPGSIESHHSVVEKGSFMLDIVEGFNMCGQLASVQCSKQFQHFSFAVVVEGDFLRWNPTGTIVTAAFNYCMSLRLMGEFLWCFNHLFVGTRDMSNLSGPCLNHSK